MEYRPLNIVDDEIRLLVLEETSLNGGVDKMLSCALQHVSLANPPAYTALSYYWGDLHDTRKVLISGQEVSITASLESVLRHLGRLENHYIWADAICINQANLDERSVQVQRMAAIYKKAQHVIAWLDTHEKERGPGIDFKKEAPKPILLRLLDSIGLTWNAFCHLLRHPYWERAWIIQEISMAQELVIMYGSDHIGFRDILRLCQTFRVETEDDQETAAFLSSTHCHHIIQLGRLRQSVQLGEPIALVHVLGKAYRATATDLKDKVFALLSLSHDGKILLPTPSYRSSRDQINLELTKNFIKMMRSPDICFILSRPTIHGIGDRDRRWYPDWFSENTWSNPRLIRYLTTRQTASSHDIDYLAPQAKYQSTPYVNRVPQMKNESMLSRAILIDEIDALALMMHRTGTTHTQRILEDPSPDLGHLHTGNCLGEHFLPRTGYGTRLLHVVCHVLTLQSSASLLQHENPGWSKADDFKECFRYLSIFFASGHALPGKRDWEKELLGWMHLNGEFLVKTSLTNNSFVLGSNLSLKDLLCSRLPKGEKGFSVMAEESVHRMWTALQQGNRLARTSAGYLGWVPRSSLETDKIALVEGCSVPVILRRRSSESYFIVGASYLVDLMDGEAIAQGLPPLATWPYVSLF